MTMQKIRLELARDHDFPSGSSEHGYVLQAPLTAEGHIDPEEWKVNRQHCRVRRFWKGHSEETGHLIRKPGGSWAFHYDINGDPDDDETGYRFGTHVFKPGEYVSIREHDDHLRTFRVVTVTGTAS